MIKLILLSITIIGFTSGEGHHNNEPPRGVFTHLFGWKYADVAKECERFLGPMGYAAVEVSPPTEGLSLNTSNWIANYQVVSQRMLSIFGHEKDFKDMIKRCRAVDVDVYVDVVLNHMSKAVNPAIGTGGSIANGVKELYPDVPYTSDDFHRTCTIKNYKNVTEVKTCQLGGLNDLDQSKEHVRNMLIGFMNKVIEMGAAGFRVGDVAYMSREDLQVIYSRLSNLKIHGRSHERPFIQQDVATLGDGAVSRFQYIDLASVAEYDYAAALSEAFNGSMTLKSLKNLKNREDIVPSDVAIAMTDNFRTQRSSTGTVPTNITWREPRIHRMATAFVLAFPYGKPLITSSYYFSSRSAGPPFDSHGKIISPEINSDNLCTNGWVCEHRWPQIARMVEFYNVVGDEELENWWDNGNNQIAFSRGRHGFIAINNDKRSLWKILKTGLPAGRYCDIISGGVVNGKCSGTTVNVNSHGNAFINLPAKAQTGVLAIHVGSTSAL